MSANESLRYNEFKRLKPWIEGGYSKSLDQMKQAVLQRLQDTSELNKEILNNTRHETLFCESTYWTHERFPVTAVLHVRHMRWQEHPVSPVLRIIHFGSLHRTFVISDTTSLSLSSGSD
jgi:hypothetical protein